MNKYIQGEKRSRRKYSDTGIKAKFLARKADGTFMDAQDVLRAILSMVKDIDIKEDIKGVFFKNRTKEFFISTHTSMYGLEDMSPEFGRMFKKKWSNTFYSFTVGVYTAYLDQYDDVTDLIMNSLDKYEELLDYWDMKMTKRNGGNE